MEIAGKEIDIDGILEEKVTELGGRKYFYRDFPETEIKKGEIRSEMESYVWQALVGKLSDDPTMRVPAEAVVAEMIRQGLDKDSVRYGNNAYKIRFGLRRYKIIRDEDGFSAGPYSEDCHGQIRTCCIVGITPKDFCALVSAFDSLCPQIEAAVERLAESFRQEALEKKKLAISASITRKTVEALIREHLTPADLGCTYEINEDGTVTFCIERTLSTEFTLPMEKIAEKLKDPGKIISEMTVCRPEEMDDDDGFVLGHQILSPLIP